MSDPGIPLYRVLDAGEEIRRDTSYFWDNRFRRSPPRAVLQVTLAGEGFFRQGGRTLRVPAGWAFLCEMPEDSAYGYPPDAREPYRLCYVTMYGGNVLDWVRAIRREHGSVIALDQPSEARHLTLSIAARRAKGGFRDPFEESELVYRLLASLAQELRAREAAREPAARCFEAIQSHYRLPLNIKTLASEVGCSREHLSREFARRYGKPPATFLRETRIRAARELLAVSSRPLHEIAREVGLPDAGALCRLFRRMVGRTPEEYRTHSQGRRAAQYR